MLNCVAGESAVVLEAHSLTSDSSNCVNCASEAAVNIRVRGAIQSLSGYALNLTSIATGIFVEAYQISSAGSYAIVMDEGEVHVRAHRITSSSVAVVINGGDALILEAFEIQGSRAINSGSAGACKVNVRGARLIGTSDPAVYVSSTSGAVRLNGCVLISPSAPSIQAASGSPIVQFLGGTCANYNKDASITLATNFTFPYHSSVD